MLFPTGAVFGVSAALYIAIEYYIIILNIIYSYWMFVLTKRNWLLFLAEFLLTVRMRVVVKLIMAMKVSVYSWWCTSFTLDKLRKSVQKCCITFPNFWSVQHFLGYNNGEYWIIWLFKILFFGLPPTSNLFPPLSNSLFDLFLANGHGQTWCWSQTLGSYIMSKGIIFSQQSQDKRYTLSRLYISFVCYKSGITQNALFFRRSFWKFNFLAITEEREIYLIISISKQCMESCQFPSTYTIISGLLDDVNNSKQ